MMLKEPVEISLDREKVKDWYKKGQSPRGQLRISSKKRVC